MKTPTFSDVARQVFVAVSAVFMVGATAVGAVGIYDAVDTGVRSPVEPAGYAFGIWALIFLLALIAAAFQARPLERTNPLLRTTGWWTAAAYACTGLWSVVVPRHWFDAALVLLLAAAICLAVVFLRIAAAASRRLLTVGERWLFALSIAPFFGWLTAANAVSFHGRLVEWGVVPEVGESGQVVGAALILGVSLVAAGFVRAVRPTLVPLGVGYAATLLWACVGIVVNQLGFAPVVVGAAVVAAGLVVAALIVDSSSGTRRPSVGFDSPTPIAR